MMMDSDRSASRRTEAEQELPASRREATDRSSQRGGPRGSTPGLSDWAEEDGLQEQRPGIPPTRRQNRSTRRESRRRSSSSDDESSPRIDVERGTDTSYSGPRRPWTSTRQDSPLHAGYPHPPRPRWRSENRPPLGSRGAAEVDINQPRGRAGLRSVPQGGAKYTPENRERTEVGRSWEMPLTPGGYPGGPPGGYGVQPPSVIAPSYGSWARANGVMGTPPWSMCSPLWRGWPPGGWPDVSYPPPPRGPIPTEMSSPRTEECGEPGCYAGSPAVKGLAIGPAVTEI